MATLGHYCKQIFETIKKSGSATSDQTPEKLFVDIQNNAKGGDERSQYYLGRMYAEGLGVKQDERLATFWYQKAAEQGSSDSQFRLYFYLQSVDKNAAIFWLTTSAGQGWGVAQFALGIAYAKGNVLPKDEQLGYFWLLLASQDGDQEVKDMRDYVGDKMLTREQRTSIQTKARSWRPTRAVPIKYSGSSESSPSVQPDTAQVDSTGSGFRVARGAIVTNHHVIDGCSRLRVNGVAAQERGSDARSDLALLGATLPGPNAILRAQRAAVGEPLSVAGYPLRGLLSGFNMTTGNLSSLSGIGGDTRLVQITAPVQPGNSGGPVLDSAGNLMGVVVSKLDAIKAAKITGDIPQNVNFAINANVLRSFLDANSVEYDTANSDKALATTVIAEKAKGFTVLVECWK